MVKWAQSPAAIFLTVCVEDAENPEICLGPDFLRFEGVGGSDRKFRKVSIRFYKEIDEEVILRNKIESLCK